MEHELKTWPMFFNETLKGTKRFEVRRYDRNFKVGDTLILKEYDGKYDKEARAIKGEYTGRQTTVHVDYIMTGYNWGIRHDFCVMSISMRDITTP
ncbi:MAG: DUF3850 domain-containing protein [Desulfobacterales bacterium]|nr:DUF3850 domain-containing protein [Desulfobacterales bacterium]